MGLQVSSGDQERTHSSHYLLFPRRLGSACESLVNHSPTRHQVSGSPEWRVRSSNLPAGREKKNCGGAQKPQSAAIKVLLCRGERTRRPPEGQREIQLPACHILSARVILGNKTARTHLCTGCRDPRRDCGRKKNFQRGRAELLFYYCWDKLEWRVWGGCTGAPLRPDHAVSCLD